MNYIIIKTIKEEVMSFQSKSKYNLHKYDRKLEAIHMVHFII